MVLLKLSGWGARCNRVRYSAVIATGCAEES
jgi:hypothetical protein